MLSVVIITKNEEQYLDACLSNIEGWVDEVIIVDSKSTDSTLNIARRYTDKIYTRELDTFSNQRNFGIDKAKGPWILSIDPDEVVTDELKKEISDKLNNEQFNAYYVPIKHYFFGDFLNHGGWYPSYLKRVFRKGKGIWENDVHEILKADGKVGYLKNPILHYSHKNILIFFHKINKYTSFEAKERLKKNKVPGLFSPIKTFLNRYFLRLGFLDGYRGFIVNFFMFFYVYMIKVKIDEIKKCICDASNEKYTINMMEKGSLK